jgi:hypothetical protein
MPSSSPEALGGEIELSLRDLPGVDARSDVLGGHGVEDLLCVAVSRPPAVRAVSRTTPRGAAAGLAGGSEAMRATHQQRGV